MKLVQTKDYLLLIDEEAEIKEGDKVEFNCGYAYNPCIVYDNSINKEDCKLLIGYYPLTKEAKELDLPLLPNPFERLFNITEWAKEEHKFNHRSIHELSFILGCEVGYEKAQSKEFNLEDIKKAIEYGHVSEQPFLKDRLDNFIQSLSTQQLPSEFIPEYEYKEALEKVDELSDKIGVTPIISKLHKTLKTITNSEGKQELVGKWIH